MGSVKKMPPRVAELYPDLFRLESQRSEQNDPRFRHQLELPGLPAQEVAAGDECYTPQALLDVAELLLDGIDTDPAWSPASLVRPRLAGYTIADDGLGIPWHGTKWLNPPYSDPWPWFVKLNAELELADALVPPRGTRAVALVKLDPTTRWWAELERRRPAICLLRARVRFVGSFAGGGTPRFASALAVWGVELKRCRQVYSGGPWFVP
jgi:hypothetical protein